MATAPDAPTYDPSQLGPQGQVDQEQLKRDYEIQGPELDPSQRYYQQANEAIYNQWADRALPQQEEARNQLQTRLYNMGLKEGDQAYDREMEKLNQQQSDAMQQAQYQATIGAGSEAQRMLGMDAATRAQLTGEQAALAGFGNQAALGQFGMGMQGAQLTDQQRAQKMQEMLGFGQAGFQNQLAGANFQNQAQAQDFAQKMASGQQGFNQQMQADQYQTQLRQQQIAEEMQRRGFSLNEINAIISGQQVAMPTMPGFSQASKADTVDYLGAANMQGQSALDAFNAEQAAMQGMMSGVGSMAGGFMMSDRKLKKNIKRIGSVNGHNLYAYDYIWGQPGIGVMADEVRHVPGAVESRFGFDAVNYEVIYG